MPPDTFFHGDTLRGAPFLKISVAFMAPATSSLYGVPAAGALPIPTLPSGFMRTLSVLLVLMLRGWLLVVPRNLVESMLLLPVMYQVILSLLSRSGTYQGLPRREGWCAISTKKVKQKTMN